MVLVVVGEEREHAVRVHDLRAEHGPIPATSSSKRVVRRTTCASCAAGPPRVPGRAGACGSSRVLILGDRPKPASHDRLKTGQLE